MRREAIGGAARVAHDGRRLFEGLLVDAHDDGGHLVGALGRGADDGLLRAGLDVLVGPVVVGEEAGGFDDVVDADVAPLEVGRVPLGGGADLLAVDDEVVRVGRDLAVELAVDRVVLEEVSERVVVEQVVDGNDLDVRVRRGGAEDEAADAAEAVDTDLDGHGAGLRVGGVAGWG